jgi:toxin ParE1/3/4
MKYRVDFSRRAREQLGELNDYIAGISGDPIADRFVDSIVEYCGGFSTFPERGTRRPDTGARVRTVGFRNRVTIAFRIDAERVVVLAIYYGGQDVDALLANDIPANDE